MAEQQLHQPNHHCRKPHEPWPQQLSPLFLLLVVLLIAGTSLPTAASSSAMSVRGFWNSELTSIQMRQSLSNRLSSLSPESVLKFLLDVKTGLSLSSLRKVLCDVGNLKRNRNAGDILIREAPQRNSTLHIAEVFVRNQISLPQIQSRLRGVTWVLKDEEENVPWRNEKFHGLDHTGTNSDNIFNLQVNKNMIQNKGDVNFNPINVNNTSGNKTTTPAPPPPQEEARTQENDTASAPSGATGSSHSSPDANSNLATGDTNSNLTSGTAGSQNPQADSNLTSQMRNPNPSMNSTSDESPDTNPSSAHLSQMGVGSKTKSPTPNSSTTAGNSDESPDTNLSTKSPTANPATKGTSEESPNTTPSSGHDSQTGDMAKPKFPTTNPSTTGTSDESPDTNSSSNHGTPQVGGGGTDKNKPTSPA